jgi:Group II intron, maturase-specific domain
MNGIEQEAVIKKLNPILRGFANYYKGVVSKEIFGFISSRVWKYLWRWAKRRHPNKNTKWVRKRYFKTIKGNKWTFACNTSNRRGIDKELILYPIAYTHILHQYIKTSTIRDQNVRKRAQNNIDENSEYHSPLCPSSTVHIDGLDAQSVPK